MVNLLLKVNTNNLKENLNLKIRQEIITVVWKIFHVLYDWNNDLATTSENFCEKWNYKVHFSDKTKNSIESFKNEKSGVIISNHQNMNFADYLPLFTWLWEEILSKCIFYSGEWNIPMNEKLFPNNEFRAATFRNISDWKKLVIQLDEDIKKIENEWGYIFVIPTWASLESKFQAIFDRIVKTSNSLPILSSQVQSWESISYGDILKDIKNKNWTDITVTCDILNTDDFLVQSKEEMYNTYISTMNK